MKTRRIAAVGVAIVCLALLIQTVLAGAGPAITWSVLSGGGAPASAGAITLNGSVGQTAIGSSAGGGLSVSSGYWLTLGQKVWLFLPYLVKRR